MSDVRETTSGCPGSDLLLLLRHELLEELEEPGEAARLRAHLDGCPSCAARAETLDEALAPPADPSPPGEVFQALEARIAADAVAAAAGTAPSGARARVELRCTYCHDRLGGSEQAAPAVYCAGCLAPHHEDCFRTHGRCAAPGCEVQEVLRRQPGGPVPARPRPGRSRARRAGLVLLLAGAGGALAAAALWPGEEPLGPPSERSPSRRGEALELLARPAEGLEARLRQCEAALALDPSCAPALVARATVRWAIARRDALEADHFAWSERLQPALADTVEAIRLEPAWLEAYLLEARLRLVAGDPQAAGAALRRAFDLDPESPTGQLASGLAAELEHRWDDALRHHDRALALDWKLVAARLGRARVRLLQGDPARAGQDAEEALRLDPGSAEALTLQAEARYLASGGSDRAGPLRDLDAALKLDPSSGQALALRAYVGLERLADGRVVSPRADLDAAEVDARRALRVDSRAWRADLVLAEVAGARTQDSDALAHATRAVATSRHPVASLLLARLHERRGDLEAAARDLEAVLDRTDGLPGHQRARARALVEKAALDEGRGRLSEARRALKEALALDPSLATAWYQRGRLDYHDYEVRRQKSDLLAALRDLDRALLLDPGLSDAWLYRALACIDAGRLEDALRDLEQAERCAGAANPARIDFYRGVVFKRLGDKPRAIAALERYMERSLPGDKAYTQAKEWLAELAGAGPPAAVGGAFQVVFEPRLQAEGALEAGASGASLQFSGQADQLVDGTALHVTLLARDAGGDLRAAFVKCVVEGGRFAGQVSWPGLRLAPLVYRARLELFLDEQRPELRRALLAEFGWPAGHQELLFERELPLGNADERATFARESLGELADVIRRFDARRAELTRLCEAPGLTGLEQVVARLAETEQELVGHTRACVVRPAGDLVQRLQSAMATLSRSARRLKKGEDPSADLVQVGHTLQVLLSEVRARVAALDSE